MSETQLIVVTINYRLSLLGFLYLDDIQAPGNQGLLDQNLALKWVYENIGNFGGDPTKITLLGESAGSASVSHHLLSKLSWPYFNAAIMESGSATSSWAFFSNKTKALGMNNNFLKRIGCKRSAKNAQIACAKELNSSFLAEAPNGVTIIVDDYFLTGQPINLLNKGSFKKVYRFFFIEPE